MIKVENTPKPHSLLIPKTEAIILKNMTLFILNLFPLPGLYAIHNDLKNTHKIIELKNSIRSYKMILEVRNGKWAKIDAKIKAFREHPEDGLDYEAVKNVVKEARFLEKYTCLNKKNSPFNYSSCVFRFILSCISFGLSALYYNQIQQRKIAFLTNELNNLKGLASNCVQEKKIKQFNNELDLMSHEFKLKGDILKLKSYDVNPEALTSYADIQKRKNIELRDRQAVIVDQHRKLQDQKILVLHQLALVAKEKEQTEAATKKLQQDFTHLECKIKKNQDALKKKNDEMTKAYEHAKIVKSATKERDEIIEALNFVHSSGKLHQQLVEADRTKELPKPSYNLAGVFDKLDIELNDIEKNYKKIATAKRSALELVRAFYSHLNGKQKLLTRKNATMSHKIYLFRLIAFNFIYGGSLEQTCHGYSLRLNQHGVNLSYSNSISAQSVRSKNGKKESYLCTYNTTLDEFTTVKPINPEIIKSIMDKLNHSEIIHLKKLLNHSQLTKLTSPSKMAKEKMELVEEAHSHLSLMAELLEKKFGHLVEE